MRGDEVAESGLFGVEDGLAGVGRGELRPGGFSFLRALVDVRGCRVEVVKGVRLEDRGVNEGSKAEGLRLFLGRSDVGLIVGRRMADEQLGGGLVERREGAVFLAVGDLWHGFVLVGKVRGTRRRRSGRALRRAPKVGCTGRGRCRRRGPRGRADCGGRAHGRRRP